MTRLATSEAVSMTLRLPRNAWAEKLLPPLPESSMAVNLLRGRLTCRQAVLAIRIEGSLHEIEEALHYWKRCGFRVEEGDKGFQSPPHDSPAPSLSGRGSPTRGSRDLVSGAPEPV